MLLEELVDGKNVVVWNADGANRLLAPRYGDDTIGFPWDVPDFDLKANPSFVIRAMGAEIFGQIRSYEKCPQKTARMELSALASGDPAEGKRIVWPLRQSLYALSTLAREKTVTRKYTQPPRTMTIVYPRAEVSFHKLFVDLATSDPSAKEWLDICAKDTAAIGGKVSGEAILYNFVQGHIERACKWFDEESHGASAELDFEEFLINHLHKGKTPIDYLIDRMSRDFRRQNKVMVYGPNSYKVVLHSFEEPARKVVHDKMMAIYNGQADADRKKLVLQAKGTLERICAELQEGLGISADELRARFTIPSKFSLPVMSLKHDKDAYEAAYIQTRSEEFVPPARLSLQLRRLGFYVFRKPVGGNNQWYALVKIRPNQLLKSEHYEADPYVTGIDELPKRVEADEGPF